MGRSPRNRRPDPDACEDPRSGHRPMAQKAREASNRSAIAAPP